MIRFTPTVPSSDVHRGLCWTESIAVTRSGAWRCMVGNGINDPCFTIPAKQDELVCGANPALKTDGFVVKLTKPLPKSSHPNRKPQPWDIPAGGQFDLRGDDWDVTRGERRAGAMVVRDSHSRSGQARWRSHKAHAGKNLDG